MLEEGVEIMKAMWTEDVVDYEGRHYLLQGAICQPKPLQSPHIPLWVAGGGEQLTLRVAARHAQYTNFGVKPEWFAHKSEVLAGHCRDLGRDFEEITRSANFNIVCAETEAEAKERIWDVQGRMERHVSPERAEEQVRLYRHNSGTPEQVIASLKEWEALGLAYAIVYFPDAAYDLSSIDLFAREVIPAFN
jgi:alkanesulfonate monooxygenase SsuD/methylene tetrahydromethanopterin reductase-like flavin-dependent oxidoreductase (luciferase family)